MVHILPRRNFARTISNTLHLTRTAEKIVESLVRAGRYLPVRELVKRVRMSERSVRKHLIVLMKRGVLRRRATSSISKRVTYEYSLRPIEEIMNAARRDFNITLSKLESAARQLVRRKSSPRSASSSRN